jgi:SSS family solute:Na+ symporter
VVVGLFCAGALAASMSTGDALLHASGSVLVRDLLCVVWPGRWDDAAQTRLIRVLLFVVSAIAYYFAVMSDLSLVALLLLSYGFIAQVAPPLLATFFWPRATRAGALAGLLVGCGVVVVFNYVPGLQWQQIHPGIWGVAANMIVLVVVSWLTEPPPSEHVAQFVVR